MCFDLLIEYFILSVLDKLIHLKYLLNLKEKLLILFIAFFNFIYATNCTSIMFSLFDYFKEMMKQGNSLIRTLCTIQCKILPTLSFN